MLLSVDTRESYNAFHERRAANEQPGEQSFHPWHRTVARRLPDLNGMAVMEVGCGRGDFAIWLAQKFPRAVIRAVDFSESAIAVARERARAAGVTVDFRVDDAEKLTRGPGTTDFLISCECLEHVPHPDRMAAELCRVLKPGGRFILTTENYFNAMTLAWLVAKWRGRAFDSGSGTQPHENYFLFWRVRRILEQAGLRVTDMESNHFQWLLLPRVAPDKLHTEDFRSPFWKRLCRPFGRHFTFIGLRPADQ